MEYEFDVVGDMDTDHNYIVGKTRCAAIDGKAYSKPGHNSDLVQHLRYWLDSGERAPVLEEKPTTEDADYMVARAVILAEIIQQQNRLGWTNPEMAAFTEMTIGKAARDAKDLAELQALLEATRTQAHISEQKRLEQQAQSESEFEQTTTPESARANAPKRQSKKD
jgi:hypothetical protein